MNTKVLVAIDSEGLSQYALQALAARFPDRKIDVFLLEVVEPVMYAVPPRSVLRPYLTLPERKQLRLRATTALQGAEKALREAGFQVTSLLIEGDVTASVLNEAHKWGAQLLVVTSHARTGAAKLFHRSISSAIAHQAECEVLIVREPAAKAA